MYTFSTYIEFFNNTKRTMYLLKNYVVYKQAEKMIIIQLNAGIARLKKY